MQFPLRKKAAGKVATVENPIDELKILFTKEYKSIYFRFRNELRTFPSIAFVFFLLCSKEFHFQWFYLVRDLVFFL